MLNIQFGEKRMVSDRRYGPTTYRMEVQAG